MPPSITAAAFLAVAVAVIGLFASRRGERRTIWFEIGAIGVALTLANSIILGRSLDAAFEGFLLGVVVVVIVGRYADSIQARRISRRHHPAGRPS